MVWVRSPVYFYKRNHTFYFSRAVPSDLCHRFNKKKIEVSLRTKSEARAAKSAAALSDRLERYWDSLRMEMIYSRELGMSVVPDEVSNANQTKLSFSDALALSVCHSIIPNCAKQFIDRCCFKHRVLYELQANSTGLL